MTDGEVHTVSKQCSHCQQQLKWFQTLCSIAITCLTPWLITLETSLSFHVICASTCLGLTWDNCCVLSFSQVHNAVKTDCPCFVTNNSTQAKQEYAHNVKWRTLYALSDVVPIARNHLALTGMQLWLLMLILSSLSWILQLFASVPH